MSIGKHDPGDGKGADSAQIRRLRRTDFTAVMQLLADSGQPAPSPDRRTLRRFRHVADDLGADVYIYLVDGALAGLLHLSYVRRLNDGPRARIETLLVGHDFRRRGIGHALLALALQRAAKRSCSCVDSLLPTDDAAAVRLLAGAGFLHTGTTYRFSSVAAVPGE